MEEFTQRHTNISDYLWIIQHGKEQFKTIVNYFQSQHSPKVSICVGNAFKKEEEI